MQREWDMNGKTGLVLALSLAALGTAGTGTAAAQAGAGRERCDTAAAHEQSLCAT
jgi:hypothetical protein